MWHQRKYTLHIREQHISGAKETSGSRGLECFPSQPAFSRGLACLHSSSSASDSALGNIGSEVMFPAPYFRQSRMEQCLEMVPEDSLAAGSRWACNVLLGPSSSDNVMRERGFT
ncbi:hypothetical protein E2C01_013904 [Portunus trituberculatus]|uniref:Uncharacterized protein n=1 Tax=Portunus trituberculatus TaxID=210409 RepID=A0A5B7DHV3_PORTR|nr:hypothetical protein [Portunus trituberculatus]